MFDDFIRTKKQCGEPTDGLTFEKFSHTLKKNRDALIQRHGCKRVKFSVYVKEAVRLPSDRPVKSLRSRRSRAPARQHRKGTPEPSAARELAAPRASVVVSGA